MSLDLNTSILTGKISIAESGWVYNYSWSHYDDCTWAAFLLYQLYYTLSLMNQFSYKFKRTAIWLVIFLALISNLGAAISGAAFIDCLTFSSNLVCDAQLHACYSFEALTFMFAYFLLFYRKLMLIPSEFLFSGFVDILVLLLCVALSLALNVVCIYGNIAYCFAQDIYQAVACSVAFFYFEIWFFYCVAVMTTMERRKKFDILQLCTQTASMNVVYLIGSISYKTWGGNFYTNAMWNMGWCMLPLFCIQAVISRRFLSHFQPAGQRTPADRDSYPKRLEEGNSKNSLRLTFSPPNSPKCAQH